jgi:acyl-CoA dehydrogenase
MEPFWSPAHGDLAKRAQETARALESATDARQIVRRLGEALTGYVAPRSAGGSLDRVEVTSLCVIREALAERSALADTLFAMQGLGSYPITRFGSEDQKRDYLSPVASGRKVAAFAITEPEAGSDVAALRAQARRDGDGYLLDATKTFISNAGVADFYIVFAKTDPAAGGRGVSAFVVDADTPGLRTSPLALLGEHPIGQLELERCRVPACARLGEEGQGLKIAFATLDVFRPTVGAAACGMAARALGEALARVRSRVQFGRALAEHQGVQMTLAELATELDAARLLVYRAAGRIDAGERATREAAMAKLYATEAAQRIVDGALQLHGASGLVAGSPTERLYRDVRALRIYEGTSEIQRLVIARELLRS